MKYPKKIYVRKRFFGGWLAEWHTNHSTLWSWLSGSPVIKMDSIPFKTLKELVDYFEKNGWAYDTGWVEIYIEDVRVAQWQPKDNELD